MLHPPRMKHPTHPQARPTGLVKTTRDRERHQGGKLSNGRNDKKKKKAFERVAEQPERKIPPCLYSSSHVDTPRQIAFLQVSLSSVPRPFRRPWHVHVNHQPARHPFPLRPSSC